MHMDPIMPYLVGATLAVLVIGLLLRTLRQPHVVGYLLAGVILGPHGIGLVQDDAVLSRLGAIGVVLMLFFVGMEVSPRHLLANWKVSVFGTLLQILVSIACVIPLSWWFAWPLERTVLIGFVISLSSTAVVLKMLQDWNELGTTVGQNVLGILLVQDLAVIPMLVILGFMADVQTGAGSVSLQIVGGILVFAFMTFLALKDDIHLPLAKTLHNDREMQIFAALTICLGLSLLTGLFGLSTALGAFVAGMLIGAVKETQWVHHSLEPFRVVFVALFFVSIGMLVDPVFIGREWLVVALLVLAVLLTNTFINGIILRILCGNWRESIYAGALLSQIGEFSFVLAAIGLQVKIISQFTYQLTLTVISLSLLLSPVWIGRVKRAMGVRSPMLKTSGNNHG